MNCLLLRQIPKQQAAGQATPRLDISSGGPSRRAPIFEMLFCSLASPSTQDRLTAAPAAIRLMDEIEKRYGLLTENPHLYSECQQPLLKATHYRKIVIGGYLMIYRVDSGRNAVIVERYFSDLEDYHEKL